MKTSLKKECILEKQATDSMLKENLLKNSIATKSQFYSFLQELNLKTELGQIYSE